MLVDPHFPLPDNIHIKLPYGSEKEVSKGTHGAGGCKGD